MLTFSGRTTNVPSRPTSCWATAPWIRLEVPTKPATKALAGSSYSSTGAASCSMRPSLKTAIRSLIVSASSWSWVTNTKVMPTSRWICLSSICISRRSLRSRAPSGSSSSSTRGRLTSARASATRCRWPPESWWGRRSAKPSSRTVASASSARRRRSAFLTFFTRSPYSTFCSTFMCGKIA